MRHYAYAIFSLVIASSCRKVATALTVYSSLTNISLTGHTTQLSLMSADDGR